MTFTLPVGQPHGSVNNGFEIFLCVSRLPSFETQCHRAHRAVPLCFDPLIEYYDSVDLRLSVFPVFRLATVKRELNLTPFNGFGRDIDEVDVDTAIG